MNTKTIQNLVSQALSRFREVDRSFLILVLALMGFGLLMVYSASFIYSQERWGDGYLFIRKQAGFCIIGLILLFAAAVTPHDKWFKWGGYPLLAIILVSLILVKVPGLGVLVGGARRWLNLGLFRFQPAEFAKIAIAIFVARQLTLKSDRMEKFSASVVSNFLLPLPIILLLLSQPDFGSTAIVTLTILGLLFVAGVPLRFFLVTLGGALVSLLALVVLSPYRMARLATFMDPWKDPLGKGFQVLQSLVGLHHGQLSGMGLGNGKEKLFFLPEAHNDFIFAVIGEELGFIGVVSVVLVFILLIYKGFSIGWRSLQDNQDRFGFLLSVGLTLIIGLQAFVNMAVSMGLLPTKGLALPLVSYGGSSIISILFSIGVILSVSRTLRHREPLRS